MINKKSKDLLLLAVVKILQVLIGLVTIRLITELLSKEQVGIYYILLTVVSLLAFGFFNPLGQYYGRHLVKWQQTKSLKNATNVLLFFRFIGVFLAFPFALLVFYFFDYQKYFSLFEYSLYIIFSLIALTHGVLLSALNVLLNRIMFACYMLATLILGLGVSLLIVQFYQTAIAWLYGLILVQILISMVIYRKVVENNVFSLREVKSAFNKKYAKKVFVFILPVTLTLFLQWGQMTSFRLIVEDLHGAEILALIAVGMSLSTSVFRSVENLLTQFYTPLYLKGITNKNKVIRANIWNELASITIPFYIGLALYVVVFSPYLVNILLSEDFYNAYVYMMIGATIEFFRVVNNIVYQVSQSELSTKKTILPYALGFGSMLLGLYLIDVSESLWKVPTIIAVSYLITLSLMYFSMKKLLPIALDWMLLAKAVLVSIPILSIYLLDVSVNLMNSVALTFLGGCYLCFAFYILLNSKVKSMEML